MTEITQLIINFLTEIGIVINEESISENSFLPGVRVMRGELLVDVTKLQWPGDLLHEAGHIAVTPRSLRATLSDALDEEQLQAHAGEVEATAWAYAAIVHLGLDPSILFHDGGYHGKSAALIMTYSLGVYPGSHGLASAGMTLIGSDAVSAEIPAYPNMLKWLRS